MRRRKPTPKRRLLKSKASKPEPRKYPLVGLCFGADWRIVDEHTGETLREGIDMKRACAIVAAQDVKAKAA